MRRGENKVCTANRFIETPQTCEAMFSEESTGPLSGRATHISMSCTPSSDHWSESINKQHRLGGPHKPRLIPSETSTLWSPRRCQFRCDSFVLCVGYNMKRTGQSVGLTTNKDVQSLDCNHRSRDDIGPNACCIACSYESTRNCWIFEGIYMDSRPCS